MNHKEKQIEEMAKDIYATGVAIDGIDIAYGVHDNDDHFHRMASELYEAGYRKANDVLERADDLLHDLAMEYAERGYMDYFCVCENVHHKVIAKLIAEMRQEVEE